MDQNKFAPITPFELKIEITRACNLKCSFCYLGREQAWLKNSHMPVDDVMRWIDWCVDNEIPGVRFTGGEATMHPDIEVLCNYAQLRGRLVILNTNAMAVPALYDRLLFHDLRVSLPTLDADHMDELTGGRGVLEKKIALLDRMESRKNVWTHILTAMSPTLSGKLEEFAVFLQERPWVRWLPLRLEASPDDPRPISRRQLQALAEEMDGLMRRFPQQAPGLFLAVPFCSVTPKSLGARVFVGKDKCCGPYMALNVNFDGELMACFDRVRISASDSLETVLNSNEMRPYITLETLPPECGRCEYVKRCLGGCTRPECLVGHNGGKVDYLAGFIDE